MLSKKSFAPAPPRSRCRAARLSLFAPRGSCGQGPPPAPRPRLAACGACPRCAARPGLAMASLGPPWWGPRHGRRPRRGPGGPARRPARPRAPPSGARSPRGTARSCRSSGDAPAGRRMPDPEVLKAPLELGPSAYWSRTRGRRTVSVAGRDGGRPAARLDRRIQDGQRAGRRRAREYAGPAACTARRPVPEEPPAALEMLGLRASHHRHARVAHSRRIHLRLQLFRPRRGRFVVPWDAAYFAVLHVQAGIWPNLRVVGFFGVARC